MEKHLVEQKDEAPWTIQQTFRGVLLTLVPWLALTVGLNSLSGGAPHLVQLPPQEDLANAIGSFFFSALIEGAFLIAPWYFASRAARSAAGTQSTRTSQLLGFRRFSVGTVIFWIAAFLLLILGVNLLYQEIITLLRLNVQTNDQVVLARSKYEPITTYAILLAAVFVAPFCEEVFFRGFVFPGLRRGMSVNWAIVFSALIFAISHADPGSFLILFIIGLALTFLRWRTRSIWPGMLLHMLNNAVGAVLIILAMHGIL